MSYKHKNLAKYEYILGCMNNEDINLATPQEKLQNFVDKYHREFCSKWNVSQWPSHSQRIEQYLRGLPSSCSVAFATYDIVEIGKEWGECETPERENVFDKYWWWTCASLIIDLLDYYDIEL